MAKGNGLLFLRKNRTLGYKIKYLYYLLFKKERLQKRQSYGELNEDMTIYIVKPDTEDCIEGLLSLVARTSLYIRYGKKHDYTVCVDWKNYKTQYYDGKSNAWNFFFEQPSQMTLEDAYKSKNVIVSGWTFRDLNPRAVYSERLFFDSVLTKECHELLVNGVRFNTEVEKICRVERTRLNIKNRLGVYLRGTDYVILKPSGEYVQPTVQQVIEKIDEFMFRYDNPDIYLVTEDGNIYNAIKEKYGNQVGVVSFDSHIYKYRGDTFLSKSGVLDDDKKKRGINYLVKMVLLSQCRYLVSSITMGSMFSYGLNGGKYEDKFIFELGLYE